MIVLRGATPSPKMTTTTTAASTTEKMENDDGNVGGRRREDISTSRGDHSHNLLRLSVEAVAFRCTMGEISYALENRLGRHAHSSPVISGSYNTSFCGGGGGGGDKGRGKKRDDDNDNNDNHDDKEDEEDKEEREYRSVQ